MPRDYAFLDCGLGRRLERFAGAVVSRPAPAAGASPALAREVWEAADLRFDRSGGWRGEIPSGWSVKFGPVVLGLKPAAGGQLGVFPEHAQAAERLAAWLGRFPRPAAGLRAVNLFAHAGLLTLWLAAIPGMLEIVHVDAAAGAVRRARENASLSGLEKAPVRWLAEDAMRFLARESRRNRRYDVIALDPPAYGRDGKGGDWKLERDISGLLALAGRLLAPGGTVCLTCHRRGWDGPALSGLAAESIAGLREIETFPLLLRRDGAGEGLAAGQALLGIRGNASNAGFG
ncbi:MAG: class I SAM-dependent methyltransferase [Planctomycetota bacterium]|jgi:23S rRNA (cytosine1962-C5)-methyltransferase|nr:class I SAM-dependent methyltransferase [Planctomycetota bacterium]